MGKDKTKREKDIQQLSGLFGNLRLRLEELKKDSYSSRDHQFLDEAISDIKDLQLDLKDWSKDPERYLDECGYKEI